ncbi:MAG TPA: TonB family protein [Saprospiraceae bacterium]|nr:TonB family protein [Saprospiraceae bacterium]
MKKEKKARQFKRKPQYPGGQEAMKAFLRKELNYPPTALAAQVEGSVLVQFTINQLGEVIHTKVISGIGYGCDQEAERIVGLLHFKTDKNRGYKSKTTQTLGIHFRLPKKQQGQSPSLQATYTISPAERDTAPGENKNTPGAYQYTIEW